MLRFHGERARPGHQPQPQQLLISDVLAAGQRRNAILLPRRGSKSTSIISVGLGRARQREEYRVGILTLTTGKAGRSRFLKDVAPAIERVWPDKHTRPCSIIRSAGQERVEFHESGGLMQWLSTEDDLRGEAFDLVILDEAQAPDPEKAQSVVAAATPTLDTRQDAQIVVAGTAGKFRAGNLLWEWLELGRNGKAGIVEYAAPESTSEEELASWEPTEDTPEGHVRELIELCHPGIGTLTTLEQMEGNFDTLKADFTEEYLSIFGLGGGGTRLIKEEQWNALASTKPAKPPVKVAMAIAVHPDQLTACLVTAWRVRGKAHIAVSDHRVGVTWLVQAATTAARALNTPIIHDTQGAVTVEIEALERKRPKPRFAPQNFGKVKTAHALLLKEIETGNLVHYNQPMLNDAARVVVKRPAGANGWLLGRKNPSDDITTLEAAAMALRVYDETSGRKRITGGVS